MVNVGVLYAITAGVASLAISVILNRLTATEYKQVVDRKLAGLFKFLLAFCIADMIWGLFTSRLIIINRTLYTISTYSFHLFAAFSAFLWAGYVIHYLNENSVTKKLLNCTRYFLIIAQLTILISNIWNKQFFYVNEDAIYESYQLRDIMFVLQFAYYIILILFCIARLFITIKNAERSQKYYISIIFSLCPLLSGFCQMLWHDAPMYSLGFMLTTVLIYSINITSQREEYLSRVYKDENSRLNELVQGLSNDFQAVYYVNLVTNSYETYGNTAFYTKNVIERINKTDDFFEDIKINTLIMIHPDDVESVSEVLTKDYMKKELAIKNVYSLNYRIMIGGKERYFLLKVIKPSFTESSNHVIIGVFDDDDRMREEMKQREQLKEAVEEAKKANKAKSEFLFNMSHDIRTPMNAILGFTSLAKKHSDDRKYLMDCLEKVSVSGQHLLALINDVLDMSRIEAGKIEINSKPESSIKLNEQLVSVVSELALGKSIVFTHCEMINDKYVLCDSLHVNQIIMNILSNAIKYTEPGGKVNYELRQLESRDPSLVVYKYTVTDSGIGMSKEFLTKIFDEFEREQTATMSGVEGTGLGMSIVKNLVDLMGGSINITSAPNVGTSVEVILSFQRATPEEIESNDTGDTKYEIPAGHRILLVDDNNLNREIALDILEDLGLEVEEAIDGEYAVDMVDKNDPGYYSLILMDIQMPRMNGYEATKKIRKFNDETKANIPIIAMTANAFEEDKTNAYIAGMNAHLAKPVNPDNLAKVLADYIK